MQRRFDVGECRIHGHWQTLAKLVGVSEAKTERAIIRNAMQKESPSFKLDESAVDSWGYELMTGNHFPEAIDIFNLNAKSYPDSGNVYNSLGEACMKSGQKQRAIESYKKSLEKDPSNDNARQKLKDLGEPPAGSK
jgi:tetratricopeptide (TPR) repeat protein